MHARALGVLAFFVATSGCLAWTVEDDDSSVPIDDDDAVDDDDVVNDDDVVDDDDVADDDDDADPPANGAVLAVQFRGLDSGTVVVSAFAEDEIAPAAEEPALAAISNFLIVTAGDPAAFRQLDANDYPGPFSLDGAVFTVLGEDAIALQEQEPGLWARNEIGIHRIPAGAEWQAQIVANDTLAGVHDAPAMPPPLALSADDLIGPIYFWRPGDGVQMRTATAPGVEGDVLSIGGASGPARGWWSGDGAFDVSAGDLPTFQETTPFALHRIRRLRYEVDDRSLVVASGAFFLGLLQPMGTGDPILRPVDAEPGELVTGDQLAFDIDPPLTNTAQPYQLEMGDAAFPVTLDGADRAIITITDPTVLTWGWQEVQMVVPGGLGRGAIRIGSDVPTCDVSETGNNDLAASANSIAAGQAWCGLTEVASDRDWAHFPVTRGATYQIDLFADRIGSSGDYKVTLYDASVTQLVTVDDSVDSDPSFRWTAPEAGTIYLEVEATDGGGGPNHAWRVAVTPVVGG